MSSSSPHPMIPIPTAQSIVIAETNVLPAIEVPLQEAVGKVLAEDVVAGEPLPPYPASVKDGYAVVAADGPGEREVIGESRAGAMGNFQISPGTVAYITTGAPVPPGADAVVQIENTRKMESSDGKRRVNIEATVKTGHDIRPVGFDIKQGQTVLQAGNFLGIGEVGILATVGATKVKVHRQPLVAVMSNGDEVVDPDKTPAVGQIRDSNRAMLLAAAAQAGAATLDLGIAGDTQEDLEARFQRAISMGADVLVTSGGVSMGDRDLIKPLLQRKGRVHFGRVLMKPGKPLTFATVELEDRKMLVFGMPGNPVSSFVCFQLVTVPVLRKMMGWKDFMLPRVHVRTTAALKLDPERPEYHCATVRFSRGLDNEGEWDLYAENIGNQVSSRLLATCAKNALLELPQASGVLPPLTKVSALLIGPLPGAPVGEPSLLVPTVPK